MYHCANNVPNDGFIVPHRVLGTSEDFPHIEIINSLQQGQFYPIPILLMRGQGPREAESLAQGPRAWTWWSPAWCPDCLAPEPRCSHLALLPVSKVLSTETTFWGHMRFGNPTCVDSHGPLKALRSCAGNKPLRFIFKLNLLDGRAFKIKTGNRISLLSTCF